MWPFSSKTTAELSYRAIAPDFAVCAQISAEDVQKISAAGFKTILCARPDNEQSGQPGFALIAAAAEQAGLHAVHIPVSGGVGDDELRRMQAALKEFPAPFFGYCRSGARAGALYEAAQRRGVGK